MMMMMKINIDSTNYIKRSQATDWSTMHSLCVDEQCEFLRGLERKKSKNRSLLWKWVGGWVGILDFLNFLNFAKPLSIKKLMNILTYVHHLKL